MDIKKVERNLILPSHASYADWDLTPAEWSISTEHYISPPSSIRWQNPIPGFHNGYQLCKNSNVLKLPEGRLVTQCRHQSVDEALYLLFRNIIAPGSADDQNCYRLRLTMGSTSTRLSEYLGGSRIRYWTGTWTLPPINTWYNLRISWWLSWGILIFRFERQIDSAWVQQGDDISIDDPLFGEETYQRVGYHLWYGGTGNSFYLDDTEIWEPA